MALFAAIVLAVVVVLARGRRTLSGHRVDQEASRQTEEREGAL
jgi:hypothetical protein